MSQSRSKEEKRPKGFTLVELLVVVAVIALLTSLLLPALQWASEESRISCCGNLLHHMGSAMGLYVADNHNMLPPACYTDELSYEYLATCPVTDQYGNTWYPTYQSGYVYRNLIGIYLGLGDCMPGAGTTTPPSIPGGRRPCTPTSANSSAPAA